MKLQTQQTLQLIRNSINIIDSKAEIILYGSRARGEERQDSDWDILILTDYPIDLVIERQFRHQLYDLELELGEVFSIFIYSKKDWHTQQKITPFYYNVLQEGVII